MQNILWPIGATFIVSLIAFVGIIGLFFKEKILNKILLLLVGFSAGALLGGAFLHIVPELSEQNLLCEKIFLVVLLGFSIFFLFEKLLHWHHHHKCGGCEIQTLPYMNLLGDGLHNFIDGLIIAAAFSVDINLGISTTIAVIAHEIPQEIGDFGVLVYGGFSKLKALFWNFISAITAILGAVVGYLLINQVSSIQPYLLALTAGGFIYIAASDLIPELNKQKRGWKTVLSFIFFLLGIALMYFMKKIFE